MELPVSLMLTNYGPGFNCPCEYRHPPKCFAFSAMHGQPQSSQSPPAVH